MDHMKFIKMGRHFRFNSVKVIGGRNEAENKDLESWRGNQDYLITLSTVKGPNTLVRFSETDPNGELPIETLNSVIDFAIQATILYSDSETEENTLIIKGPNDFQEERQVNKDYSFDLNPFRVGGN
jgi:hypothetical protein